MVITAAVVTLLNSGNLPSRGQALLDQLPAGMFSTAGQDREPARRLTIVLAQGMDWDDLQALEARLPARAPAAAAAMVVPIARGWPIAQHTYLTMGTGAPANMPVIPIPPLGIEEHWLDSPASDLYWRLTGEDPGSPAILVPAIHSIRLRNEGESPAVRPGLLAGKLADRGIGTALYGHGDALASGRWAAVMAMDPQGKIPFGSMTGVMVEDGILPAGRALSWDKVLEQWLRLPPEAGLVVIESGDFLQLEQADPVLASGARARAKKYARDRLANGLDRLLQLAAASPGRNPVWLIVPGPPREGSGAPKGFGYMKVWPGYDIPGPLLSSPSTRRLGLVSLADILPSILDEFGIHPGDDLIGRPFVPVAAQADMSPGHLLDEMALASQQLVANDTSRPWIIKGYVLSLIIVLGLSLLSLLWSPLSLLVLRLIPPLAAMPLVFLLLPWLGATTAASRLAWIFALGGAVAAISGGRRVVAMIPGLAALTAAAILLDSWAGGFAAARSPLGHSLLGGARYYGIGNEYAGVLIGATAVAAGAWRDRQGIGSALAMVATGIMLMGGFAGANFGGGLAAMAASAVFTAGLTGQEPGFRRWGVPAAAAAAVAATLVIWDMYLPGQPTHVGRAFSAAVTTGWHVLPEIAQRKLLLNFKLIRYTIWSRVLIASLAAIAIFVFKPAPGYKRIWSLHRGTALATASAVAGALTGLVLNDSGVVLAATTMVFPSAALLTRLIPNKFVDTHEGRV